MEEKVIIFLIIVAVLSFGVGWTRGFSSSVSWCVDLGLKLLELNNISLEINEGLIKSGIARYNDRLGELLK